MATSHLSEVVQHLRRAALPRECTDLTDGKLLECFISRRDVAAIEALVQRHGRMVWGVCRRVLRNHHDAEDAFQATFLVLVRKAASIVPREMVGNWLYGVANQTARKARATIARRRVHEKQVAEMPEPAVPVRSPDLPWVLDEELCHLPDKYRVVLLQCDLEGKTRQEVARQLGCPEGTVAGRLTRGRVLLAKRLARHGLAVSGGSLSAALAQQAASASVPTSVVAATVKAATLVAAGPGAVTGLVSTKVAALVEGVLKAMLLTRLKIIAVLVLTLCVLGTAASVLTHHALAEGQSVAKKEPAAQAAKPPKEDKELLQGTWHIVAAAAGGKHQAKETSKDQIWVFTRDKLVIKYADGSSQEMRYQLDPKPQPKAIDLAPVAEPEKGYTFKGIYELDGTRLQLYYSRNVAPDAERPMRFEPAFEDRGMRSFLLKRAPVAQEKQPRLDASVELQGDAGGLVHSLPGHKDRLTSVAYSPDGKSIATAAWDGTARIWDARTGKEVRRLEFPATKGYNTFSHIAFSPDNAFIVTSVRESTDASVVIVWNRRTGEKVRAFPAEAGSVAVSPDGSLIACGGYRLIRLYEFATGKLVREMHDLDEKQLRIESLTFSPDGKTLISTGHPPTPQRGDGVTRLTIMPDVIRVWDAATGKERPSALNGLVVGRLGQRLALSPDGRTLAHPSRNDISLLETATGGERARLTGHKSEVCDFAFSPDGRTLASGSMDGTVRLWDLPSGKKIGHFGKEGDPFKGGWVLALAFSPDGRSLVSGGLDKTAHIWDVSKITGRPRTSAERSPADLEADWKDLGGDAAKGYAALGRLISSPKQAVPFLGKQLQSAQPPDTKRIERLIGDLDHKQFQAREQAAKELTARGEYAVPLLQKALAANPSLEVRRRLEALLDRLDGVRPSSETLCHIRAVEALESIGNPEALWLIETLATGPVEMRLTQEARTAAGRLIERVSVKP